MRFWNRLFNKGDKAMAEKVIKQKINADLEFNHLDPHFARFEVHQDPVELGESELYGMRPINITPDMFPADFELADYDVSGSVAVIIEIKKKK